MDETGSTALRVLKLFALGALLAGLFWAMQGPPNRGNDIPEILITEADVAHHQSRWENMWGRPPTPPELKKAMDGYVRNEILYREALAREMDREDPRVRLALIQKMQMLSAGQADAQSVSGQELEAFYALRKPEYTIPARVSVKQLFFKTEATAKKQTPALLEQFNANEPSDEILQQNGDMTMLANTALSLTAQDLEQRFGTAFTAEVLSAPSDEWFGPVRSGYGWHLVKVFDRIPSQIPELAEVREKVVTDLLYENRQAAVEQGFQEIASRYQVVMSDEAKKMLQGDIK